MNYTRYSLLTLAAAALLLLPLLLPQAASAQSLVAAPLAEAGTLGWDTDASAGGGDCVGGETVGNPNLTSFFRTLSGGLLLGQSFTAPCSGLLTSLEIVVYNSAANPASDPASGELLVFEGAGTGGAQLVAEPYELSPPATPDTFEERTIEFLSDVEVVAGETYTYVMNQVEGGGELQPIGDNAATFGEGSFYFTQDGVVGNMVADEAFDLTFTASFAPSQQQGPSVFADNLSGASSVAQLADGRVLVTTFDRVTAFNADGSGRTVFADNLDGPEGITQLSNGRVLVTEVNFNQGSGRVVAFNADGSGRTTFSDNLGSATGVTQLTNDQVLVGEPTGARVVAFNADGTGQVFFAENITPWGLTQLADGRVLVVDYIEDQVVALNANGSGRTVFADGFDFPRGITQLADGRVLVTNVVEDQVVAFNANGSGRTIFADGFVSPTDVTQLADGRVLVTDEAGQVLAFSLTPPTASEGDVRPDAFVLGAAYPNPVARGGVTVPFSLERAAEVRLALYDVLGRRVAVLAEGPRAAGPHEATLATDPLPSGVYVVRLWVDGQAETRRITVVR